MHRTQVFLSVDFGLKMGEQLVEYGLRQMCEHRWGRELTDEERLEN